MKLRIQYQEQSLDTVLRYFASGFESKPGERIHQVEFFTDTVKGVVVFKLYVEVKDKGDK